MMLMQHNRAGLWGLGFILALIPWALWQAQISIPADMAWLALAAEKFWSGAKMSEAFHDSNPPLCYLIYLPVVLLKAFGVSLWGATFFYGIFVVSLFTVLLALLVHSRSGLASPAFVALMAGYLLPLTFLYQIEFGNKDHLIAAALLPFLLAQRALMDQEKGGKFIIWLTLILATPFILMKPHYGLLPVCLLAQRFFSGRRWKILRDPDFLCLTAGTVIYSVVVAVWFSDFISDILLQISIDLYAGIIMYDVFKTSAALLFVSGLLWALAHFSDAAPEEKRFAKFLAIMAGLATIPFAVQMKGFSLHMIPCLSLGIPGAFMVVGFYLPAQYTPRIRGAVVALIALVAGYGFLFLNPNTTHDDYRHSAVAALISRNAGSGFMMQAESTNVVIPLSVYTGVPHVSRFSSFWFVSYLAQRQDSALTTYYAAMMAQDIEQHKPGMIALYHDPAPADDMQALFGGNEEFRRAWAAYHKVDELMIQRNEFYKRPGIKTSFREKYDIYIRE